MNKLNLVIGNPVQHSLSPDLHSFFYRSLVLQNKFKFEKKEVSLLELEVFVQNKFKKEINALAVTIPHKVEIMKYLDEVDLQAKNIGAVNTVINKNHVLIGYNTDWLGTIIPILEKKGDLKPSFDQTKISSLFENFENPNLEADFAKQVEDLPHFRENNLSLKNQKVALIGAGGAARAMAYSMIKFGARLTIFNRTVENAIQLKESFEHLGFEQIEVKSLEKIDEIQDFDIIINSTSVGLTDDSSPLSGAVLKPEQIIFDAVYKKSGDTKLILEAKQVGAKTITGKDMLFWQGVYQMRLHCGLI
jgi:shikimate dehydrogenase